MLIQTENRPVETEAYNNFNFILDLQPGFDDYYVTFGVQQINDTISMYKATYDQVSETWSLADFTPAP